MSNPQQSAEQNQDDFVIMTSPLYQQLNDKYQGMIKKLFHIFNSVLTPQQQQNQQQKRANTPYTQQLMDIKPKGEEKFLIENPDILIDNIKDFFKNILEITDKIIVNIVQREGGIMDTYDKIQLQLEKDILKSQKDQQHLEIKNKCYLMKTQNLQKIVSEQEDQLYQYKKQLQQAKKELDYKVKEHSLELINMTKIKEQALSQSRRAESHELMMKRSSSNFQFQPKSQKIQSMEQQSQHLRQKKQSQTLIGNLTVPQQQPALNDQSQNSRYNLQLAESQYNNNNITSKLYPQTVKSDQFNVLKSCLSTSVVNDSGSSGRKYQNQVFQANRQKEIQQQQYQYELTRLKIQLTNKEKENEKLQKLAEEFQKELRKLKEEMLEEDKKKWAIEVNSDKNPNLINYYKSQIENKTKQIKQVQKSQRKFAIQEKKLIVKEKAFEQERSDYHGTVLKQSQRIDILMKIKNVTKEQLEFLVKLDMLERKGLTIRSIEQIVDYLNRKGVTLRDFSSVVNDDLKGKIDNYKLYQKIQKEQAQAKQQQQTQQQQQQQEIIQQD